MRRLQVDLCLSTDEAIGTVLANAVPETTDVLLHVEVDQALLLRVVEGNALVVDLIKDMEKILFDIINRE